MRRRMLGEKLRLIVLTTPLLRVTGCGNGNWELCDGGAEVRIVSLVTPPGSGANCHDACGGTDQSAFLASSSRAPGQAGRATPPETATALLRGLTDVVLAST